MANQTHTAKRYPVHYLLTLQHLPVIGLQMTLWAGAPLATRWLLGCTHSILRHVKARIGRI
jgi:hypothetical protein